jgi:hypothetical protein
MMVLPNKRFVQSLQKRVEIGFYTDVASIMSNAIDSYDQYGQPIYAVTEKEVACSFTDKPSKEAWANYADIESIEAEVRFVGDKPSKGDTVKLKSMYGRDTYNEQGYTEQEFEIVAIRDRDVFGYVCALKEVQI